MIWRKAWGDLTARKARTLLVVLSIAVGVFGISAIKIAGDQIERGATERTLQSNPPDLTVSVAPLSAEKRDKLKDVDNVRLVEGRLTGRAQWRPGGSEDRKQPLSVVGVATFGGRDTLDQVRLVQPGGVASAFPKDGEVLVEKGSRQKFNLRVGQEITLFGAADAEHKFKIVGFGENPNVVSAAATGQATVWLTRADADKVLKLDGDNRLLLGLRNTRSASERDNTDKRVRETLEANEVVVLSTEVRDPASFPGQDMLNALRQLLLVFALLGAVASGLLVINTISTIIVEQRPQIGSMKAVGASTVQVMATFVLLALLYGLVGTALGLAGGIGLNVLAGQIRAGAFDEEFVPPIPGTEALALALGVGLGVSVLAAVVPSFFGSRLSIREAMVSYGLSSSFGTGPWDRLVARLTGLPQAIMLASRNVFRQTSRALLTIAGLGIATGVILAVFAGLASMLSSLETANNALQAHVGFTFDTRDTTAERDKVREAIKDVDGIDPWELWVVSGAKTKFGTQTVNMGITGLPLDTTLLDRRDRADGGTLVGRWLEADKTDQVVITQRLATKRQLKPGDEIELEIGSAKAAKFKIVGIVLGIGPDAVAPEGAVYAPFEVVREKAGLGENRGTQLYARIASLQDRYVNLSVDDAAVKDVNAKTESLASALSKADLPNTPIKLYEQQDNSMKGFVFFIVIFVLMILIVSAVGALGLFSTLTMNVLERRREIGVLRSVGASTSTVLWTFLLEGLLLGLLGWAIGAAAGGPSSERLVQFLSDNVFYMEYLFPPASVVITLVAVVVVAFIASIGPSLAAARMRIAEILRYA